MTDLDILILDDDQDLLYLLEQILSNVGARVRAFDSPASAIAAIKERAPDVIISDLEMPECDGCSFMRQVRALPDEQGVCPAIMLSGHASSKHQQNAVDAGFDAHLRKPMRALQLFQAIERVRATKQVS